jgi:hypothetical protein
MAPDFDTRHVLAYFEVHYWPDRGQIVLINYSGPTGAIVSDVRVMGEPDTGEIRDATMLIALALANAGRPEGDLFEHKRHVYQVDTVSMSRTRVPA